MIRTRRCVLLLVLTVAVVLGASLPANALFSATAAPAVQPSVSTAVVTGPLNVHVETTCRTSTRVITRVYETGTNKLISTHEAEPTYATSDRNVESNTTSARQHDTPSAGQYTTIQTIQDTKLLATGRWEASPTPGIAGYKLTAFITGGVQHDIGTAGRDDRSMDAEYDASVLNYRPVLSVVTVTSYGWTAPGTMSSDVTC